MTMNTSNIPNHEGYIKLATSKYKYPDRAKRDILSVCTSYRDMKPRKERYVFNNGSEETLLCLEGTIPIVYRVCGGIGCATFDCDSKHTKHTVIAVVYLTSQYMFHCLTSPRSNAMKMNMTWICEKQCPRSSSPYNIPVCLWVMDAHPYSPPMVYICPSNNMKIIRGRHVDANGRIELPYLHEWRYPDYDLLGLVQTLCIVFGEDPPVTAVPLALSVAHAIPARLPRTSAEQDTNPLPKESSRPLPRRDNHSPSDQQRRPLSDQPRSTPGQGNHPLSGHGIASTSDQVNRSPSHQGSCPPITKHNIQTSNQDGSPLNLPIRQMTNRQQNQNSLPCTATKELVNRKMSIRAYRQQDSQVSSSRIKDLVQSKMSERQIERYLSEQYSDRERVKKDVLEVLLVYSDLKPGQESIGKEFEKKLLVLEGSVPAADRNGTMTHVDVIVWVLEAYPQEGPLLYVLSETTFRAGIRVDNSGKVTLPYTNPWKEDNDLLGMFSELSECI